MELLVACEESQEVTKAFRRRGVEAFSCDIRDCSGGHPEWHIKADTLEVISSCGPFTQIIAHPPCTALSVSGNGTYAEGKAGYCERLEAVEWTENLWALCKENASSVVFENPCGVLSTKSVLGKASQYIQPWMFGHMETKKTGLWLHNAPKLRETNNVWGEMMLLPVKERCKVWYESPGPDRARNRSRTYPGVAEAMADQWYFIY